MKQFNELTVGDVLYRMTDTFIDKENVSLEKYTITNISLQTQETHTVGHFEDEHEVTKDCKIYHYTLKDEKGEEYSLSFQYVQYIGVNIFVYDCTSYRDYYTDLDELKADTRKNNEKQKEYFLKQIEEYQKRIDLIDKNLVMIDNIQP